jgi:DNA-binding NtrC family response regulator
MGKRPVKPAAPQAADPSILVVDDQPEVCSFLGSVLGEKGFRVLTARTPEQALEVFAGGHEGLELVLLDLSLTAGRSDGLDVLRRMKAVDPAVPVIILSGKGTIRRAVEAVKLGAADFLEKDLYLAEHLELSVEKVRRLLAVVEENRQLRQQREQLHRRATAYEEALRRRYTLVGESRALARMLEQVAVVASVPRPVLIRGERGTGKELIAAQVHFQSPRADGPFITVNCAAFTGGLLESELFGHEKGAFTGAEARRLGRFELADGGTIFFDEVGNMPVEFQQKVLRVVEYQEFERVGGSETVRVDVRVVAATNADLERLMREGRFRRDLYDRLTFAEIPVPPLRERSEDIPLLIEHFQQQLLAEVPGLSAKRFAEAALERLRRHPWPGNVRELRNIVERAISSVAEDVIQPHHLGLGEARGAPALGLREEAESPGAFHERVEAYQRRLLCRALEEGRYRQRQAARQLGMTYHQFRHYYRKFHLDEGSAGGPPADGGD